MSGDEPIELLEELGSGALGSVHRVRRVATGEVLAGKIPHDSAQLDPAAQRRFLAEARVLAGLRHPNVVAVEGIETWRGRPILLMEVVDGPTLQVLVAREGPLAESRVRAILQGIARGLAAAHGAGVVHRDLKPSNILVAPGDVAKVADFGLARGSSFAGVDPNAFAVLGTPEYMAPECVEPLAVDARSDLYALGCIAFELLVGRPPYSAPTALGLLAAHASAPIPAVPAGVEPALAELVRDLLSKRPADRPPSADVVLARLESLANGSGALAVRTVPQGPRCASCDAVLLAEVAVCMECGAPRLHVAPGSFSVVVVGPGDVGDKLDATLREALLRWVAGEPQIRQRRGGLHKRIPRLPFVLLGGLSEDAARAVAAAMARLGVEARAVDGWVLRMPEMRSKSRKLVGRTFSVVTLYFVGQLHESAWVIPGLAVAAAASVVGWVLHSTRAVLALGQAAGPALDEALSRRVRALPSVVASLEGRRRREDLRALTGRVLELHGALGAEDPGVAAELGRALDVGARATLELDHLDTELAQADVREASEVTQRLLRDRDRWSTRLAGLAGQLEALRVRTAAAASRASQPPDLDDLRAGVEVLEDTLKAP